MNRVLFPSSLAVDSQRSSSHKVQRVTINFLSINFSFMEVLFIFSFFLATDFAEQKGLIVSLL